jgi:hypothetical protein
VRENVEDKGRRYLVEGRLRVVSAGSRDGRIVAECRGSDRTYVLGYDPYKRQWRCTCQARGRCSHLVSLQLVTTAPAP